MTIGTEGADLLMSETRRLMKLTKEEEKIIRDIRAMKSTPPEGPLPVDCLRHLLNGGWVSWPEYSNCDFVIKLMGGEVFYGDNKGSGTKNWRRFTRFNTGWFLDRETSVRCRLIDPKVK
jgi:hypothetical protein